MTTVHRLMLGILSDQYYMNKKEPAVVPDKYAHLESLLVMLNK